MTIEEPLDSLALGVFHQIWYSPAPTKPIAFCWFLARSLCCFCISFFPVIVGAEFVLHRVGLLKSDNLQSLIPLYE
jgi:hypothetical protein